MSEEGRADRQASIEQLKQTISMLTAAIECQRALAELPHEAEGAIKAIAEAEVELAKARIILEELESSR